MEEFDPTQMFTYTASQLADYIEAGKVSKEELYANGYPAVKRPALEEELTRRRRVIEEDDEMWQWAKGLDTISAYETYLATYDTHSEGSYRGKHVFDARARVAQLRAEGERLKSELFDAMRYTPWLFTAETINYIIRGVDDPDVLRALKAESDVASRFIGSGQTISFREIKEQGIIPDSWTIEKLIAPDAYIEQRNIGELGEFPTGGRTDVYFLGVPRGGKSSVMAGVFYEMYRRGKISYEPQLNEHGVDNCQEYYQSLIRSVDKASFPVSTNRDTISFMKIQLTNNNRRNPLTFVEIAGEDFRAIADGHLTGAEVWQKIGAARCLQSRNRKLLTFIVDYAISKPGVRKDDYNYTDLDQGLILANALQVLGHDGSGKNGTDGCTLSRVDTIAVIVTKSDLMGDNMTAGERLQTAMAYLTEKFSTFMNNLLDVSRAHGINKPNRYQPYVIPFSLGKLVIGNKYLYDSTDSATLIDFISDTTTTNTGRRGLFN